MSLATDIDENISPKSDRNNPAPRASQNKSQLLEATMRNVPKLKELNYIQWKNVITSSIKKAKLWGYVDGSIEEPPDQDSGSLAAYYDEAAAVRNAILGSLEPTAQKYVEEALDPRDAWITLEKKYLTAEADVDAKFVSIEKQLADMRLEEGGDIVEHMAEFCRMRSQLNGSRFTLDDQASIGMLYRSLPQSLRQSVVTPEGKEMRDFSALCARLSYLSQNPEPEAPVDDAPVPSTPIEDYTSWGVPVDIKTFGLTGDKNPLLEERAAVTCRDCLLKDHEAGTPECPQYEWRRELWGEDAKRLANPNEGEPSLSKRNKKFVYEFSEPVKVALSFQELKLKESLANSLSRSNLRGPLGIQQCAILPTVHGRNVIAQSPSETGKTTAIIISALQTVDAGQRGFQALIISPTDQKVMDIHSMINSLGYKNYASKSSLSTVDELAALTDGHAFSILTGTPDRVLTLLRRGMLRTLEVRILALDDLDLLVDKGFHLLISDLYRYLPHSVQTLTTGTTLSDETLRVVMPHINNPLYITINYHGGILRELTTHAFITIPQQIAIDSNQKPSTLSQIVQSAGTGVLAAVLCTTSNEVRGVNYYLGGYCADERMNPESYSNAIDYLRHQKRHLATDCSMPLRRTLGNWDADNLWIINYDVPSSPQKYIERISYLGVCSGKNMAITLVNDGTDEINLVREIEKQFGIEMNCTGMGKLSVNPQMAGRTDNDNNIT